MIGKSVKLAALLWQLIALAALTEYCAPMIGLVGQLATRRPQVALPRRLPTDWPFNGHQMAIKVKVEVN